MQIKHRSKQTSAGEGSKFGEIYHKQCLVKENEKKINKLKKKTRSSFSTFFFKGFLKNIPSNILLLASSHIASKTPRYGSVRRGKNSAGSASYARTQTRTDSRGAASFARPQPGRPVRPPDGRVQLQGELWRMGRRDRFPFNIEFRCPTLHQATL